ncbi:MAC/Perforin domain [Carpediemonas membranifera]|uniref:MAC/Perforin domain n=1 Tax=Carpediemonas membranifera TaxID=201153 RepID=A0A8J6B369_9EUKA|nr:MAC/Perforin domain [Carpediemonas membranifera]|eukprot:KAG9394743.1 MAC/Perforin domain [Carpediemonas membranifera]
MTLVACDVVPGIEAIQTGYDIVTGEGYLAPIFKFNYNAKKTFYNPIDKRTYTVPDEIDISMIDRVKLDAVESVVEKYSEYLKQVYEASWFGIQIGIPGYFALAFSKNKEMQEVHYRLSDKVHSLATGSYRYEMYEMIGTMPEFMELDDNFATMLSVMPATIHTMDDQELYNQFVGSFGTHVSYKNVMGGKANLHTYLDQSFVAKKDSKWVAEQLSFSFTYHMWTLGAKYFHNKTDIHVDKEFQQNAQSSMYFYGGATKYQQQGSEHQWLASVTQHPFALNATLLAIDQIIPDAKIAANVRETIAYYVKHSAFPTAPLTSNAVADLAPIPGADFVGHGVDDSNLGVPLKPVVDFTYGSGKVWVNPIYTDLQYAVPDQIPAVENTPESFEMNGTFLFDDVQDYVRWSMSSSSSHGLFHSKSKTTKTFYERYYENDQAMSMLLKEYSWYTLVFPPFPPVRPSAALASILDRMPTTYSSDYDKKLWDTFVAMYGTAYYTKAVMGGQMNAKTWFHKCFLSEESAKWVSEQSGWSIFGIISKGHAKKTAESKIDHNFNEYHHTDINFVGGDNTIQASDWEKWVATIKKNPAPIDSTTMPLESLIQITHGNLVSAFKAAKLTHQQAIGAQNAKDAAAYAAKNKHETPDWCHKK